MKELAFSEILIQNSLAEQICADLYKVHGTAVPLPGEIDFNFKIVVKNTDSFVLKVSRPHAIFEELEFQQNLLQHLESSDQKILSPKVIKDKAGESISEIKDAFGHKRYVRLLSWIPGRIFSTVNPQLDSLRLSLGEKCGSLTQALLGFDHPYANRKFEWDIAQSLWTLDHTRLLEEEKRNVIAYFQTLFSTAQPGYNQLRKSVIHNDANDNNVIVSGDLKHPKVIASIDYGDAIYTQTINDLAICCAYGSMNQNDPLGAVLAIIRGYHSTFIIKEEELEYLYVCIAMRLVITITKSAINKLKEPDNTYLQISERPAWEVLKKWRELDEDFVHYSMRQACGFSPHPNQDKFKAWASSNKFTLAHLFPSKKATDCLPIDLSVSSKWLGHLSEFADFDLFQFKISRMQQSNPDRIIAGGYLEPRMVYSTEAYEKIGNNGAENRTVHLGVDFWLPAGTPVHAVYEGEIVTAINDAGDKEYGGLIILKHEVDQFSFYSLYGHLSVESATSRKVGERIKKGDYIASLGDIPENGNWPPHLHFELMLSMLDFTVDFPGVAYKSELEVWKGICPDPNLLFKLNSLTIDQHDTNNELIRFRKAHLGRGMSLSYDEPIQMVRGMGVYLIDQFGHKYLDTVNNVAHVGHEHPAVVKAGQEQMALINTNTRYLHKNIETCTQELLETLPPELCVVHYVNSGSEANELAIRMAKSVTGQTDILAAETGYHGNTNACVAISSYKFDGKGGGGCPEHTHIFPLPDTFRGKYKGENAAADYAGEVKNQIESIEQKGRSPAAFIIEPIISCGGQIELPEGFLAQAYKYTREAGGLCISDEVQVGCGRVGKSFWGFQLHDVLPDIITIGKPLGNGHPVAAVVCTQEVADQFANGMEYFNTFGGNPVSCAIASEVLKTIKTCHLQANALAVGAYLKAGLRDLAEAFPILADIRGQGLFLGIELTDGKRNPLAAQASYLANRMKDFGILMSVDGPDLNVLKIKPPIIFSKENADQLIQQLKKILNENYMNLKQ